MNNISFAGNFLFKGDIEDMKIRGTREVGNDKLWVTDDDLANKNKIMSKVLEKEGFDYKKDPDSYRARERAVEQQINKAFAQKAIVIDMDAIKKSI